MVGLCCVDKKEKVVESASAGDGDGENETKCGKKEWMEGSTDCMWGRMPRGTFSRSYYVKMCIF